MGEKRFVNSVKVFPASINPIQKYPHIIESYACILKAFVFIFLLPINVLISFGICSTPKESKYVTSEFQYQSTHQDLLHIPHLLFFANYL